MDYLCAVITADVINSKNSNKDILKFLESKNIYYNEDKVLNIFLTEQAQKITMSLQSENLISTDVSISRGDEIQVFCSDIINIIEVIRQLRYYFRPLKIRIGVGIGGINTEKSDNSWNMDGEAFFKAREALDKVKIQDKKRMTYICSPNEQFDIISNSIYMLMDSIINEWSDSKWESVNAYEVYENYEKAGNSIGKSRQSISNNCKTAHFEKIKQAEEDLKRVIDLYFKNKE
ncbi:SatD family protein [Terrisporobacter petrolearius]|uniref:SatD family protein n=1 Tax=Terrisporobacter petrolearius TaxID=1460447 RepID=UPI001D16B60C|nr:SatD family protein [Terrisporobacter petrolearius]MCC3864028.1 SatD family protein [Terrisporobacter petrolearius]